VTPTDVGLAEVAGALALVAVAIGVSIWEHARLEGEIAVAAARAFVQLTAIGFVIEFIFERDSLVYVFALIAVMIVVGTLTARHRARKVPGAFWPLLIALSLAGASTLGLIVALGATSTEAARPLIRSSLRSGMIPLIDQTKTTGLVAFPGIMVGSLLAGADPVDAVRLQLVILYALLGAVSLAALTAMALSFRNFFTPAHQLREPRQP
jgi:putative ABC transport system permease protein